MVMHFHLALVFIFILIITAFSLPIGLETTSAVTDDEDTACILCQVSN